MADRMSKERRSYVMSRIRSKNTRPEITVRSLLHRMGYRFRLGGCGLPGRPDIVLPRHKAVIFVHGCFWHAHKCRPALKLIPKTRRRFWVDKFIANVIRDELAVDALENAGWRVCVVWECELENPITVIRRLNVFMRGRFISAGDPFRISRINRIANKIPKKGELMAEQKMTDKQVREAYAKCNGNKTAAARSLNVSVNVYKRRFNRLGDEIELRENVINQRKKGGQWVVETNSWKIKDVDDVIRELNVDMAVWRVKVFEHGNSDVTMKIRAPNAVDRPFTVQNTRLKVVFERIVPEVIEDMVGKLLKRLEGRSPVPPKVRRMKLGKKDKRNALEIALMDPHYGMRTFIPASDAGFSPEFCAQMVMESLNEIIDLAKSFGPFEEIILPMGNDFFHTDSIWNETTSGTGQPEAETYYHTFIGGESLAIQIIEKLRVIAPIRMYFIPGNHDRTTSFMLGRVMRAYYKNDPDVTVDASPSPYKFCEYGCNLIGYEHGHSVTPIRLAALMANEAPEAWSRTKNGYREWHLGDQHRKGSAKPSIMEEQGVSVEYLPSITAPNEWHRLKSFNWQKRGTMAFVWNRTRGPIARLQVNVDRYLNRLMGR